MSISFSLAAVLLMVALVGGESPRLGHELPALVSSLLNFIVMTIVSALSFYLMLKNHRAKWFAQALMWACVAGTGIHYLP